MSTSHRMLKKKFGANATMILGRHKRVKLCEWFVLWEGKPFEILVDPFTKYALGTQI